MVNRGYLYVLYKAFQQPTAILRSTLAFLNERQGDPDATIVNKRTCIAADKQWDPDVKLFSNISSSQLPVTSLLFVGQLG